MSQWRPSSRAARAGIDLQPTEAQDARSTGSTAAAAQDRPQPRQQFPRAERLGQIVIGTDFEPDDTVGLLTLGGQHQHRHIRIRSYPAQHFKTIEIGQHDIEDDRVGLVAGDGGESRLRIGGGLHRKAVAFKVVAQHGGQPDIVVDDQDRVRHAQPFVLYYRPYHMRRKIASRRTR